MKIISDIRLYKSSSKNEFGSFITESFGSKKLIATIKRIVMKLRENNFSIYQLVFKSSIIYEKLLFSGRKQSGFAGYSNINKKSTLKGAF